MAFTTKWTEEERIQLLNANLNAEGLKMDPSWDKGSSSESRRISDTSDDSQKWLLQSRFAPSAKKTTDKNTATDGGDTMTVALASMPKGSLVPGGISEAVPPGPASKKNEAGGQNIKSNAPEPAQKQNQTIIQLKRVDALRIAPKGSQGARETKEVIVQASAPREGQNNGEGKKKAIFQVAAPKVNQVTGEAAKKAIVQAPAPKGGQNIGETKKKAIVQAPAPIEGQTTGKGKKQTGPPSAVPKVEQNIGPNKSKTAAPTVQPKGSQVSIDSKKQVVEPAPKAQGQPTKIDTNQVQGESKGARKRRRKAEAKKAAEAAINKAPSTATSTIVKGNSNTELKESQKLVQAQESQPDFQIGELGIEWPTEPHSHFGGGFGGFGTRYAMNSIPPFNISNLDQRVPDFAIADTAGNLPPARSGVNRGTGCHGMIGNPVGRFQHGGFEAAHLPPFSGGSFGPSANTAIHFGGFSGNNGLYSAGNPFHPSIVPMFGQTATFGGPFQTRHFGAGFGGQTNGIPSKYNPGGLNAETPCAFGNNRGEMGTQLQYPFGFQHNGLSTTPTVDFSNYASGILTPQVVDGFSSSANADAMVREEIVGDLIDLQSPVAGLLGGAIGNGLSATTVPAQPSVQFVEDLISLAPDSPVVESSPPPLCFHVGGRYFTADADVILGRQPRGNPNKPPKMPSPKPTIGKFGPFVMPGHENDIENLERTVFTALGRHLPVGTDGTKAFPGTGLLKLISPGEFESAWDCTQGSYPERLQCMFKLLVERDYKHHQDYVWGRIGETHEYVRDMRPHEREVLETAKANRMKREEVKRSVASKDVTVVAVCGNESAAGVMGLPRGKVPGKENQPTSAPSAKIPSNPSHHITATSPNLNKMTSAQESADLEGRSLLMSRWANSARQDAKGVKPLAQPAKPQKVPGPSNPPKDSVKLAAGSNIQSGPIAKPQASMMPASHLEAIGKMKLEDLPSILPQRVAPPKRVDATAGLPGLDSSRWGNWAPQSFNKKPVTVQKPQPSCPRQEGSPRTSDRVRPPSAQASRVRGREHRSSGGAGVSPPKKKASPEIGASYLDYQDEVTGLSSRIEQQLGAHESLVAEAPGEHSANCEGGSCDLMNRIGKMQEERRKLSGDMEVLAQSFEIDVQDPYVLSLRHMRLHGHVNPFDAFDDSD
ncbi:hypothetical protein DRE_02937 [Drechslerella stenobrocha 248]|uniref:Uncharacterized protein n=1 Tax=Drechslerella stenobrocha 248 TaxID=1043628 RepID=W7I5J1_9PEZI|nr:hypothetical protein DRE_02937 [Drechslerella stenobrocha 248]